MPNQSGYKGKAAKSGTYKEENYNGNYYMLPLIIILAVLPFIIKMKTYKTDLIKYPWFENIADRTDLFLYYKQWTFIAITVVMALIIIYEQFVRKKSCTYKPVFIPLAVYGLLSILSAIFSDFKNLSFLGSMDQFESLFALLGYCIVAYYAFRFVRTEQDVKTLMKYLLISVLIMSILGLTQFIGHDFFNTKLGRTLITNRRFVESGSFDFTFLKGTVYLTLYNPNYVGIYTALLAPIFLVLLLFSKKLINSLLYLAALIGLMICLIGSNSLSGIIGVIVAGLGMVVFLWRYLLKRFYITIPIFLLLAGFLAFLGLRNDGAMIKKISNVFNMEKAESNLTEVVTGDDAVGITYKGNRINIALSQDVQTGQLLFDASDGAGNHIDIVYDDGAGYFVANDERFQDFSFNLEMINDVLGFYVRIDGKKWSFSNMTDHGDNTYYYYNRFNKWDKIANPPAAVFEGYERFASGRGYLWSRTIPMLKDYLFMGSGPDTYTVVFPQSDYVGFYNYGYEGQVITKPHSLYLQIAVQTGVLSLLAVLVFYSWYLISCIRLYIHGRFTSFYAQIGVSICVGTLGYMVAGLANDSSITTAPIFWCLIGIGIAVNAKAKPLIRKELEELKAAKSDIKVQ